MTATVEATRVTADEVQERLARGEPITFVDVRNPKAWGESPVTWEHAGGELEPK